MVTYSRLFQNSDLLDGFPMSFVSNKYQFVSLAEVPFKVGSLSRVIQDMEYSGKTLGTYSWKPSNFSTFCKFGGEKN